MIMRELSLVFLGLFLAAVATVGYFSQKKLGANNIIEEAAEEVIERGVEDFFKLPAGSLEGMIDFTPGTPENKQKEEDCKDEPESNSV